MKRRTLLALAAASSLVLPPLARAQTVAQPELPKEKLVIVTKAGKRYDFNVEMALTQDQQTTGLMFRPTVPANGGMLFDWGGVRESNMWMRNTVSALDMIFIDADGTIHSIAERTIPQSLAIISSDGAVRATLEVAAGTAERLGLKVGDKVQQRIFGNAT